MQSFTTSLPRLVEVKLLGELGKRFGRIHKLYIETPAEAIRALAANCGDEFLAFLYQSEERGLDYRLITDDPLGIDETMIDLKCERFIIAPLVRGRGGGIGKIVLGVVLIAAAFFMPASIGVFGMMISSTAVGVLGASMVLQGIHQQLASVPKTPKKSEIEKRDSFLFSGHAEPGDSGLPVPVGYGRHKITDLVVISMGISIEEIYIPPSGNAPYPDGHVPPEEEKYGAGEENSTLPGGRYGRPNEGS